MNQGARTPPGPGGSVPWGWAGLAAAFLFGIYAATLAPTTGMWDASEYITTAHILGIPHPPGNPLFVVLGRAWILLLAPTGLPVAVRVNLLAAATSAGAAFFWFLVAHRVLGALARDGRLALAGAAASVVMGGTAFTVWNQSNVNEKVYTLSVLVIAAVSWLVLRWRDRRHLPGSERLLLVAAYLMALGSTNHLMSVLPLPAVMALVLATAPATLVRPAFLARLAPLLLLGVSLNLFLPVRAELEPVINEGDPVCTSTSSALAAVWTGGRAGCPALGANLRRVQYSKPPVTRRMAPLDHQLANWFQYFDWQWARGLNPSELPGTGRTGVTLLFLALGVVGLGSAWRADRGAFLYLGTLTLTLTLGLVIYLNFRYGYSMAPEVTDPGLHEVRERDYFFTAGFALWGVLAGMGLAWSAFRVAAAAPRKAGLVAVPVVVVALLPLALNWRWATRAGDYAARDWAWNLLVSVEPYAVLFTNGDNDTFPLWYLQEVEGVRRDVTVVVGQYLFTEWYPRQLAALTGNGRQRPYDPSAPGSIHPDAPAPSVPVTTLEAGDLRRVGGEVLDEDMTVPFPELALVFPAGMRLNRANWLTLRFIVDSHGQRPVYFTSAAGAMAELGLSRFAVREGLVHRLRIRAGDGDGGEGLVQLPREWGGEWFEVRRSLRLWDEAYTFRGLRQRDVWADRATLNIPRHFQALAFQLAQVAALAGEPEGRVEELEAAGREFAVVAAGGRFGVAPPPAAAGRQAGG